MKNLIKTYHEFIRKKNTKIKLKLTKIQMSTKITKKKEKKY